MISEPVIARLAPRLEEGTEGEEALEGPRGSVGGPIIGIHEKRRGELRKNGEMDWVKLPVSHP